LLLVLVATFVALAAAVHDRVIQVESFDGFKVYRAFPEEQDLEFMRKFEGQGVYDFWTEVRKDKPVDIMVPPTVQKSFTSQLTTRGVRHEVMIPNVQALIDLEKAQAKLGVKSSADHDMSWTEYHTLDDMYSYLDYLEATFDFVTTQSIGKSGEGRDMRIAKICKGECGAKPAIWIDGGIHAREWISPATVTWMLRELVENDAAHSDLTDNMDWYFLPSHNPDGYAFSREENRMWRKTRSEHGSIFGCKGVDANRNWGYQFNTGGSSNDKCSDTYHGPEAFSEVENQNVRDFVMSVNDKLVFYNSIHSYSQLILIPWGYTETPPANYDYMEAIALKGSDALTAVHGKFYETGCIPCMLYIASGSSADWALGEAGIQFSISMELRDTGYYGFILPADQIIPTAEEVWAFHTTAIREIYSQLP
jgi:murein tripeptide amidase MpaA